MFTFFLFFFLSSRISGDVRNGFEEDSAFAVPRRGPPVPSALSRAAPARIAQSPARPLCPSDIIQQPVPPYRRQGDGDPQWLGHRLTTTNHRRWCAIYFFRYLTSLFNQKGGKEMLNARMISHDRFVFLYIEVKGATPTPPVASSRSSQPSPQPDSANASGSDPTTSTGNKSFDQFRWSLLAEGFLF